MRRHSVPRRPAALLHMCSSKVLLCQKSVMRPTHNLNVPDGCLATPSEWVVVMILGKTSLLATLAIRADVRALPLVTLIHLAPHRTRNISAIALGRFRFRRCDWLQSEVRL